MSGRSGAGAVPESTPTASRARASLCCRCATDCHAQRTLPAALRTAAALLARDGFFILFYSCTVKEEENLCRKVQGGWNLLDHSPPFPPRADGKEQLVCFYLKWR